MKSLAIAFSLLASCAFAEEYISPVTGKPVPTDGKFTIEQYKARDERVMQKTGGFLIQHAEGPQGLFVDAREKARLTVDELARVYKLGVHLDANIAKEPRGEKCPLEYAQEKMAKEKPLFAIVIVDKCEKLPALSVYPEERIGIVNADKLQEGDDPSAPEMRVSKEAWRALGFVTGIGFSQAENDIMQPIYTIAELDANRYPFIQPMNMAKMQKMCKYFGVKKEARIPYRVACNQGWAPAPTNKYQKAVWEQVKAEKNEKPSNPIKVKYDKNATK